LDIHLLRLFLSLVLSVLHQVQGCSGDNSLGTQHTTAQNGFGRHPTLAFRLSKTQNTGSHLTLASHETACSRTSKVASTLTPTGLCHTKSSTNFLPTPPHQARAQSSPSKPGHITGQTLITVGLPACLLVGLRRLLLWRIAVGLIWRVGSLLRWTVGVLSRRRKACSRMRIAALRWRVAAESCWR